METNNQEDKAKLDDLQKQLDALQVEKDDVGRKLDSMPGPFDGNTALPIDRLASEATSEEIERAQVVRDPWAGKNALKILSHPPGRRLQWISPQYRERRGMRGWEPVRFDDAIGRELHKYITDPPTRMEGLADIGSVVRRGDVVLASIDEGIFQARRQRGLDRANRNLRGAAGRGQQQVGPHGRTTDSGLTDDNNSQFRQARPAPGFISPQRLEEYRRAARGNVETDEKIEVTGRRLFDDPR